MMSTEYGQRCIPHTLAQSFLAEQGERGILIFPVFRTLLATFISAAGPSKAQQKIQQAYKISVTGERSRASTTGAVAEGGAPASWVVRKVRVESWTWSLGGKEIMNLKGPRLS